MYSPLQTPPTRRGRARRVAALLSACNRGDHLAVSGQDALRASPAPSERKADRMLRVVNGRSLFELDVS